jgi:hypothetical protein
MPETPGDKLLDDGLDTNDIFEEEEWEEAAEVANPALAVNATPESAPRGKRAQEKPLRQRIEEYFERKRLEQALDEELNDDIFKY